MSKFFNQNKINNIINESDKTKKFNLRNKKLKRFGALFIVCVLFGGLALFVDFNNVIPSKQASANTFIAPSLAKKTNVIGGRYQRTFTKDIFPNFKINAGETEWEVGELDKTKDDKINYNLTLKNNKDTIVFRFYSNNGGINAGANCVGISDVEKVNDMWYREKMPNQSGETIGYYYIQKNLYSFPSDANFESQYQKYVNFTKENKITPKSKSDLSACGSAHRVDYTQTSIKQKTPIINQDMDNAVAVGISVNDGTVTPQNLKIIEEIITNLKL